MNTQTTAIKIRGGNYAALDTGDGYVVVKDVPLLSEWAKGDHGAPYAGTKEVLDEFVETAQRRYREGHFCATAYKEHNPEVPISHPDFVGFGLPNRVGKYKLESGEKWTIFGDIKMDAGKFADARAGKMPYVSVEVPWAKRRIRGVAFLDTIPPQYEYALFTVQEPTKDATAQFQVHPESVARFMADAGENDMTKEEVSALVGEALAKFAAEDLPKTLEEALKPFGDYLKKKPDPVPVETNTNKEGAKMSVDPEFAAKFAASQDEIAQLKGWRVQQENADKSKRLIEKADAALTRKAVSEALHEQIAKFAADAVTKQDGEKWFDQFVESLKPSLRDKPPSTVAEFAAGGLPAADPGDPVVAKFAQEGPDAMEQVGKFASQWRALKRQVGDSMQVTEENFINNELGLWKAKRNGADLSPARR